jgi:hypothetical protein
VFEGVIIPRGTRSAKKGITNEEEMGKFLTAVFAETLNGKIILPKPNCGIGVPSRILNGLEQKLRRDYRSVSKEWGTSKDIAGAKVEES